MAATQSHPWFNGNQYTADRACEYCRGVDHHEFWCITQNIEVSRAWQAVLNPSKLGLYDELILHALGVTWIDRHQRRGPAAIR